MLEGAPGATHERPGRLLGAERRDLLQLLRCELARSLATVHLLALDVRAAVLDDLGVRQRGRVSDIGEVRDRGDDPAPVSYTHLRAHETRHDLVCRLLLEKKT